MEQKQQWIDNSESYLALFTHSKQDFLCRFVTMDETWIHHFASKSNRQLVVSDMQLVKAIWNVQKHNRQLTKSRRQFLGMRTV